MFTFLFFASAKTQNSLKKIFVFDGNFEQP